MGQPKIAKKNKKKKRYTIEERMKLWQQMLQCDTQAIIDVTIMRGMAKREDFYP